MSLVYTNFLQDLWGGVYNASSDTYAVAIVSSNYTPVASDHYLSTVSAISGAILGKVNLTGVTVTGGILMAANPTVSAVTGVPQAIIIYRNTTVDSTSGLMLYIDQGLGFGVNVNGNLVVSLPTTVGAGIFPLGGRQT